MSLINDCIESDEPVRIDSTTQTFYVQLPQGGGNVSLGNALALRATGEAQAITAPDNNYPAPGLPAHSPGDTTVPKFTFFIYDHLGNSRILYANKFIDCNRDITKYLIEHALDYYPYGKTLREYVHNRERHQTTYHERDEESGLDNRGARLYDGEVGRFLGVDPLAALAPAWTPFRYCFNNPVLFTDPDGLFESKEEAKKYAKENGIKTGWMRRNKIVGQSDGTYAIENQKGHKSISKDKELGILTAALVVGGKKSQAYTRSVSVEGAFGGGIKFEIGYAQDNHSNSGIYFRVAGQLGYGGGISLFSAEELTPKDETDPITLSDIQGNDISYNLDIGPIGLNKGGNQISPRPKGIDAFTEFGDRYTTGGFSVGDGVIKAKIKPKLNIGARVEFGVTKFLTKTTKK